MQTDINIEKVLSELYVNDMTDNQLYNFVLSELFNNDVKEADNFMLSKKMGYTTGDLNRIKRRKKNWFKDTNK